MSFGDLSAFQRDLLVALAGDPCNGLDLRRRLERDRYDTVRNQRLYDNLDVLAERGLVAKDDVDDRENEYSLTDAGRDALDEQLRWYERQLAQSSRGSSTNS